MHLLGHILQRQTSMFLVVFFAILGICINLVAGVYSAINTCQASLIHIKSMKC